MTDFQILYANFEFWSRLFSLCSCWCFLIKNIEEKIFSMQVYVPNVGVTLLYVKNLDRFCRPHYQTQSCFENILTALLPKRIRFLRNLEGRRMRIADQNPSFLTYLSFVIGIEQIFVTKQILFSKK